MAEHHQPQGNGTASPKKLPVETTDRGFFDCFGKKEEKTEPDAVLTDLETEEENHALKEELQRSNSNSSSSSYEEVEGGEKKRKKKKGLKQKIKDYVTGEKEEEVIVPEDTKVPVEKFEQPGDAEATRPEDGKRGFMEKIKDKLPVQHKKAEEGGGHGTTHELPAGDGATKEKKGILEKIKEKLPGHHTTEGKDL